MLSQVITTIPLSEFKLLIAEVVIDCLNNQKDFPLPVKTQETKQYSKSQSLKAEVTNAG